MKRLGVVGMLGLVLAASEGGAQGLSLGEHYVLRAYTGQAFGQVFAQVLKAQSLHVLTNNTTICASIVGAIGAGYLDAEGKRSLAVTVFASPEEVPPLNPREEAVALIFGGQATPEVNYALTKNALASLAKSGYQGALFFHLRIWVPGFVGKAAQEDPAIAQYLAGKENLYTVTVDANAGVARVWQVKVEPGRQTTVKEVFSAPMNPTWLSLFKRSL